MDGLSRPVHRPGRSRPTQRPRRSAADGKIAYFPLWSTPIPGPSRLAERLAHYAPGDLNRVFFTTGGGEGGRVGMEAGQAVLQARRQTDQAQRSSPARSPTTGPLRCAGDHRHPGREVDVRAAGPRGTSRCPTRISTGRRRGLRDDPKAFGLWAANRIAEAIEFEAQTPWPVFLRAGPELGRLLPRLPGTLTGSARSATV